jgi:hypothetical protein
VEKRMLYHTEGAEGLTPHEPGRRGRRPASSSS